MAAPVFGKGRSHKAASGQGKKKERVAQLFSHLPLLTVRPGMEQRKCTSACAFPLTLAAETHRRSPSAHPCELVSGGSEVTAGVLQTCPVGRHPVDLPRAFQGVNYSLTFKNREISCQSLKLGLLLESREIREPHS